MQTQRHAHTKKNPQRLENKTEYHCPESGTDIYCWQTKIEITRLYRKNLSVLCKH